MKLSKNWFNWIVLYRFLRCLPLRHLRLRDLWNLLRRSRSFSGPGSLPDPGRKTPWRRGTPAARSSRTPASSRQSWPTKEKRKKNITLKALKMSHSLIARSYLESLVFGLYLLHLRREVRGRLHRDLGGWHGRLRGSGGRGRGHYARGRSPVVTSEFAVEAVSSKNVNLEKNKRKPGKKVILWIDLAFATTFSWNSSVK